MREKKKEKKNDHRGDISRTERGSAKEDFRGEIPRGEIRKARFRETRLREARFSTGRDSAKRDSTGRDSASSDSTVREWLSLSSQHSGEFHKR